jgi:hypothetical protein
MSSVVRHRGLVRLPGLIASKLPQLQCGLSSMSMYGSQTQPWSNVRQQTLDEYASKVREHLNRKSKSTWRSMLLFVPWGLLFCFTFIVHKNTLNFIQPRAGTAHPGTGLGFSYSVYVHISVFYSSYSIPNAICWEVQRWKPSYRKWTKIGLIQWPPDW